MVYNDLYEILRELDMDLPIKIVIVVPQFFKKVEVQVF